MTMKDYYQLMGISRESTGDEVRKAYRKLVMEYHPDRNRNDPNCEGRMKEINEAYQVLGDKEKRRQYDLFQQQSFNRRVYYQEDLTDDLIEILRAYTGGGSGIKGMGRCRGGFGKRGCKRRI
ncbi:MAG: J domain-containing protein [Deltaproteobacteria bacterium]|nr:J domain-containing protein [Deltaproteobacteria bacterium]